MSAEAILGKTTPCGWQVTEKITTKQHSGGTFSTRYLVEDENGSVAFLKAMDLSRAFKENDRITAISNLIREYEFERNILILCNFINHKQFITFKKVI